jgi:Divergent InlB B-repeat domain/PASTA domain/Domain of unknown function DUF11
MRLPRVLKTRKGAVTIAAVAAALLVEASVVLASPAATSRHAHRAPMPEAPVGAGQSSRVIIRHSVRNDVSPALRTIPAVPFGSRPEREGNRNPIIASRHRDATDTVVQSTLARPNMPSPTLNFDGVSFPGFNCFCAPPDTNGEVGATQYVQIVNQGFEVFDKATGSSVYGPADIATLWSGMGGVCESDAWGDPVVVYDQLANRWVISQFAGYGTNGTMTDECVAVSTTSDATGSYNRYDFFLGSNFFDYPKLGVWSDGYYMSMNVFNASGTAYLGPQPFAFNRAAMLVGDPATYVTPGITGGSSEDPYLPADVDGSTPPPAGAPDPFVEFPGDGTYKVYRFHVDWGAPASATFTLAGSPAAAAFTRLCPVSVSCVPQNGTTDGLDGLADRLMFRAAYRNFGDHESLVSNYTVSSSGIAGVRWFELRSVTSGTPSKQQESTYQPDTTWRWMGSAAMDNGGDLALGFSASSAAINPQIRYAGRLATDPPNTLAQGEAHLVDGTGSQVGTFNRWGDYSDLTVDPSDDCTFWYTNEYYSSTGQFNWRTRVGNFRFAECTDAPPPSAASVVVSKVSDAASVGTGGQIGFKVTLANVGSAAASSLGITDNLPGGNGLNWSLGSGTDSGWSVVGSPPNQQLAYSQTSLAAGATTHVHVVSGATVCGSYTNVAGFTTANGGSGASSASVSVIGCAPPPPPPPPPPPAPLFETLTVTRAGTGSGAVTSSPAGISCGAVCSIQFSHGATVTLSAAAASGSTFTGWSGACSGTGSCTVSMTADRSVTASFARVPKCVVPRVVGLTLAKARARIAKAHCRVGKITRKLSSRKKKGRVIAQSPTRGKILRSGSKVNLTVGKGPRH